MNTRGKNPVRNSSFLITFLVLTGLSFLVIGCGSSNPETGTKSDNNEKETAKKDEQSTESENQKRSEKEKKNERKLVKQAFQNYKNALLNQDGEEAVRHVSSDTVAFYGKTKNRALNMPENKLKQQEPYEKLMVLMMRLKMSASELSDMEDRDVFAYAVDNGWIGKKGVRNTTLQNVKISNDQATVSATRKSRRRTRKAEFDFVRENGAWKYTLMPKIEDLNKGMRKAIQKNNVDENTYLTGVIQKSTGEKPEPEIWQPLQ